MRPRPKYQVFISSTYADLREEREAVTWAILTARHIPAGMENFTATDDRGWKTIKSVIDRSDYYVLLLAGRYGSPDSDGKSWTEKEYEYAVERGIPVLAFVRNKKSITADMVENDPVLKAKLDNFVGTVRTTHLCREWDTKADLVSSVTNALRNHIDDDEDNGRSRPGWYRGNELPSFETLDEFARLSNENARLHVEIEALRSSIEEKSPLLLVDHSDQIIPPSVTRQKAFIIYYEFADEFELKNAPSLALEAMLHGPRNNWSEAQLHPERNDWMIKVAVLNTIEVVQLGVQNNSNSSVEHVVVDFSLKPILGFYLDWSSGSMLRGLTKLTRLARETEQYLVHLDFVRRIGPDQISIRLRISHVPAGGTEYLPDLFVLGAVKEQESGFNLTYKIVGNRGFPQEGSINYETTFSGVTMADEGLSHARESFLVSHNLPDADNKTFLTDILL